MLNLAQTVSRLSGTAETIQSLVHHVEKEQAVWKPSTNEWSILEVINHLADEEDQDFRTRFDLILNQPDTTWPAIHPSAWVTERAYNSRDLSESLERFLLERDKSITWLKGLASPDLERSHVHPSFGTLSAGDLLASWVAHDLLHIRQLTRLHYGWLEQTSASYDISYAGDW
jgi:hypothetical protein